MHQISNAVVLGNRLRLFFPQYFQRLSSVTTKASVLYKNDLPKCGSGEKTVTSIPKGLVLVFQESLM